MTNDAAISVEDTNRRLDLSEARSSSIERDIDELSVSFQDMRLEIAQALKPLAQMQRDISETKEIVEAWSTAKNLARFIKWLAGILAGVGAVVVIAKSLLKGIP